MQGMLEHQWKLIGGGIGIGGGGRKNAVNSNIIFCTFRESTRVSQHVIMNENIKHIANI